MSARLQGFLASAALAAGSRLWPGLLPRWLGELSLGLSIATGLLLAAGVLAALVRGSGAAAAFPAGSRRNPGVQIPELRPAPRPHGFPRAVPAARARRR
jgi:hypothetical protein